MDRRIVIADAAVFLLRLLLPALIVLWLLPAWFVLAALIDPANAFLNAGWLPVGVPERQRLISLLYGVLLSYGSCAPQLLASIAGILLGWRFRDVRTPQTLFLPALLPVALLIPSSLLFSFLFGGPGIVADVGGAVLVSFLICGTLVRFTDGTDRTRAYFTALAVFFAMLFQPWQGPLKNMLKGTPDVAGGLFPAGVAIIAALPGALLVLFLLRRSGRLRFLN
jgi:hypothetical protein